MPRRNYSRTFFSVADDSDNGQTPDDDAMRLPKIYDDALKSAKPVTYSLLATPVYAQPSTSPEAPIEDEITFLDTNVIHGRMHA